MGCCCSSEVEVPDPEIALLADKKRYTVDVPMNPVEGWGNVKRATSAKDGLSLYIEGENGTSAKTIWDCFQMGLAKDANKNFLGTRKWTVNDQTLPKSYKLNKFKAPERSDYVYDTYKEVEASSTAFGRGLVKLGQNPKDNVGLYSLNRAEWVIAAIGLTSQNMRWISLYATLGGDAIEYIVHHASTACVVVSKENLGNLIKIGGNLSKTVKMIVQFDATPKYGNDLDIVDPEDSKKLEAHGIKLIGMSEVVALGNANQNIPLSLPQADDLGLIMYTSGTTGDPKGVLIKHSQLTTANGALRKAFLLGSDTVHLSYLPLAHIFECAAETYVWACGGTICFSQGDIRMLTEDLKAVEPTMMCGVPRVYSRMYQSVMSAVAEKSCFVQWFFNKAYNYQREQANAGLPLDEGYDNKIFKPMRNERMGLGRCKLIISGAAPCPPYVLDFLRVLTNAPVLQGYGMTETCAGLTVTTTGDTNVGHVGPPVSCVEVVLRDIPDMNYYANGTKTDPYPKGEVLCRGGNIFEGYYKNPKADAEAFVDDPWGGQRWLATGDVGRWNPNGSLSIIDRKKNMCKLSQGEYVSLEKVEDVYGKAALCGQIVVYGNAYKSFLVAVIVPNTAAIQTLALERGWWPTAGAEIERVGASAQYIADLKKMMNGPHKDTIKKEIVAQLKAQEGPAKLNAFEKIKDIYIEVDIDANGLGFSEENGCLTPSMKKKRKQLTEKFLQQLKDLYTANGEAPAKDEKW